MAVSLLKGVSVRLATCKHPPMASRGGTSPKFSSFLMFSAVRLMFISLLMTLSATMSETWTASSLASRNCLDRLSFSWCAVAQKASEIPCQAGWIVAQIDGWMLNMLALISYAFLGLGRLSPATGLWLGTFGQGKSRSCIIQLFFLQISCFFTYIWQISKGPRAHTSCTRSAWGWFLC